MLRLPGGMLVERVHFDRRRADALASLTAAERQVRSRFVDSRGCHAS